MNRKVLLVDDDQNILLGYSRILRKNAEVTTAPNAVAGMQTLASAGPFAAVVADYQMPEMDGIEFLKRVQKSTPDTTRLMLTGQTDLRVAMQAVNEGHIFRFLTKPCPYDVFLKALEDSFRQYQLVTAEKELLEKTLKGSIKILIDLLALACPDLFMRTSALAPLVRKIAQKFEANVQPIELALMFSRLGNLTLPPAMLSSLLKGEPLSDPNHQSILDQQPQVTRRLLQHIPRLEEVANIIGYLGKNFDGSGFPIDPLAGEQIPLGSRILRVVLDFDDLRRNGHTEESAYVKLSARIGFYDQSVFTALKREAGRSYEGMELVKISVAELAPGMVVADNVVTTSGVILLREGTELSELFWLRLLQFNKIDAIVIPLRVWKRSAT